MVSEVSLKSENDILYLGNIKRFVGAFFYKKKKVIAIAIKNVYYNRLLKNFFKPGLFAICNEFEFLRFLFAIFI